MAEYTTTDYGDMTLAKLDSKGVEFLLKTIENKKGNFGDFVTLKGVKDGEPYQIRAGGLAAKLFIAEEKNLIGQVISIIPSGEGMQRKYSVKTVAKQAKI